MIRTRQAGNHSTSFIVCVSGSAPEYGGDMPLFTLTLLGYVEVLSLSHVQLFVTPWTVAHQALLSVEFSRQEYWSGLPFPSPGDLLNPGIKLGSPAL